MDNKPYLSIKNLSKKYNEEFVLNELSLDVFKYEKIGVIGLSGSGKSTLLRLIFGLLDKDGGEITLENDRVKDRSEVLVPGDDRVKYVRQNYELFPDHTVFENIEHQIRFHTKEYIEKRVKRLLKSFDIEKIRDVKTKLCSGGEQQRVAICCALAESPKLLLLDEPMAHLDPINANLIKNYLWDFIDKEQITTIFVTHSSEDALAFSSRIAVIHKGQIAETASPSDLYFRAKKKVSAQLLGVLGKLKVEMDEKLRRVYIRPENVFIDKEGEEYTVSSARYFGDKYLVKATLDKNVLYFYHNSPLEKKELVKLSYKKEMLIFCK